VAVEAARPARRPKPSKDDWFPRAARLDPLRAALAKLDAVAKLTPEPPLPKTPPAGRGSKRARREPN